ncbi:alpha-galactosidase [Reichenbachiella sp. 5M10]|uniref:Alpha-galactosidase n=1 Tax=Reichenbachiella agariperforans TaxID=156994 RepID=A0A1M6PZP8_REIAG|nr:MULTISPECIES: glycoside hydrolase family 27 protein [Reichenbachiella]PIB36230.1 alpha-galactosidase [Reichenbachiella sp. 5M10]RJE72904.1 alpha-galactosidase [Reichenbachiella sp. MSK19-1]SHK13372.1 alpha-galactosidase [Reichenbachiella agariperforans]
MKKILIVAMITVFALGAKAQKFEGLADTPPMGWNSWNKFACDVTEDLIKETADAMVSSGMKDAGYEYIVIDDCWHGERDSLGFIQADPARFPSGIKALADYVHSKGLKFGIYSDAGWQTCGGRPGSRGREYQDAMTYASWGVDYLKYDWCNTEGLKAEGAYLTMRDALYEAGRPIVLSICEWGDNDPWDWAEPIGHLWRTTGDIYNCFDCEEDHGTWSSWGVLQIIDMHPGIRSAAGPGHWNDPDMMEVGNGMTVNEDRAHFALWAMQAAPLIAGNDIRNMSPETLEILTNKDVIAIDQDTLGVQGYKHIDEEDYEVWVKPLAGGDVAICFLNRTEEAMDITFDWATNKLVDPDFGHTTDFAQSRYDIYNVWTHKKAGNTKKALKASLPGRDVLMLRLSKK